MLRMNPFRVIQGIHGFRFTPNDGPGIAIRQRDLTGEGHRFIPFGIVEQLQIQIFLIHGRQRLHPPVFPILAMADEAIVQVAVKAAAAGLYGKPVVFTAADRQVHRRR